MTAPSDMTMTSHSDSQADTTLNPFANPSANLPVPSTATKDQAFSVPFLCPTRLEPWFEDGNIILNAKNSCFKVHTGVLIANSPWFEAMLTGLNFKSDELFLRGITAQELQHCLRALYDRSYASLLECHLNLDVVVAFLRVGTRYNITHLRQEALSALHVAFPSTLAGATVVQNNHHLKPLTPSGLVQVINLAREAKVPEILPFAFYLAARTMSTEFILHGDRSRVAERHLTVADQRTILSGRERLRSAHNVLVFNLFVCRGRNECDKIRKEEIARRIQPGFHLESLWKPVTLPLGLCEQCVHTVKRSHAKGMQGIWDVLPRSFNLKAWPKTGV